MIYFANPSTPRVRAAMAAGRIGAIMSPAQGNRVPPDSLFIVDNGCGPGADGQPGGGYPGDRAYLELLARMSARARRRCLFAVAPDVLCDPAATIERSARFVYRVRAWFGLPVALVAQDGLEHLDVPWTWSTAWKLGPAARGLAAEAGKRHKHVHMGRVNSLRRLRYADAIGCGSADGTFLAHGPDVNLPRVLDWLDDLRGDGAMFEAEGFRGVTGAGVWYARPALEVFEREAPGQLPLWPEMPGAA